MAAPAPLSVAGPSLVLMRWTVHGERSLYDSPWVGLGLADVELPDGERFDHHVVRVSRPAAGTVVHDPDRGLLLLYRHRFISDTWGWEIPAGGVDEGETPARAAAREVLEETGWRPGPLTELCHYFPSNGLSSQHFHCFAADRAEHVGEPVDTFESDRVEWVPVAEAWRLVEGGAVTDGLSLTALSWAFAFGSLAGA